MNKDEWLNNPALLCGVCFEPKEDVKQRVDHYLVEARGLPPESAKRLMCGFCAVSFGHTWRGTTEETMRKPGKGKMKLDAAVTQVMKFEACFRGIICIAKRESWTHARILEERTKRIFEHPNWPRLPMWCQQAVQRFSSGAISVLDCTCVHWQLYLDGERVKSADVPEGEWARVEGCFEWLHSGKPYNPAKPFNPAVSEGVIDADR